MFGQVRVERYVEINIGVLEPREARELSELVAPYFLSTSPKCHISERQRRFWRSSGWVSKVIVSRDRGWDGVMCLCCCTCCFGAGTGVESIAHSFIFLTLSYRTLHRNAVLVARTQILYHTGTGRVSAIAVKACTGRGCPWSKACTINELSFLRGNRFR